jgi:hypothetical protein
MLLSPVLSYYTVNMRDVQVTYYFALATTVLGIAWLAFNFKHVRFPAFGYPLILYIIFLAIWANFNGEIDRRGWVNYIFNNLNLQILFILIIIYNTEFTEKFIKYSLFFIKITIVLAFVFSLIQLVSDPFFFTPREIINRTWDANIYQVRRMSIFGYVNANGVGLIFLPLVSIYLGYQLFVKKNYVYLLGLAGIVSFASNNRYVMVGFLILLILILISKKINFITVFQWLFAGIIVLIVLIEVFKFIGYDLVEFYNRRIFSEGNIRESTRYLAFEIFLKFFPEYWFVGNGLHLSTEIAGAIGGRSSQIHIGYLSHLVSYGILGSLMLFTFWYMLARDLYKTAKRTFFYGTFIAFMIFFWANATLVHYSIYTYGLLYALIFDKYFKDKQLKEEEVILDDQAEVQDSKNPSG